MVADRDRDRLGRRRRPGPSIGPALAVLDRVDDQVAQDALDPPARRPRRRRAPPARPARSSLPRRSASGSMASMTCRATTPQVGRLGLEQRGAGVVPADLQQVGEQRLEPVQLGLQDLGAALDRRVEAGPGLVQDVGRHPHRRQRGAQLVRHVGDEPALHPGQVLELADLALQAGRHPVERRGEPGQVVLAPHPHPLLEPARGEPLGDPRRHPHRGHHLPGHQPGDAADQDHQAERGQQQRVAHQAEGLLLLVQREQEVQLVGADRRDDDRRADDQRRAPACPDCPGDLAVGPLLGGGRLRPASRSAVGTAADVDAERAATQRRLGGAVTSAPRSSTTSRAPAGPPPRASWSHQVGHERVVDVGLAAVGGVERLLRRCGRRSRPRRGPPAPWRRAGRPAPG